MGETRNAYTTLFGKPEGERSLGRPKRRWKNNIRMDHGEVGFEGVNWIYLAQDKDSWLVLVNTLTNFRFP
jgi:hypothetical protein